MSVKNDGKKNENAADSTLEEEAQYKRAKILTKPLPQILDEMDAGIEAAAEAARGVLPHPHSQQHHCLPNRVPVLLERWRGRV